MTRTTKPKRTTPPAFTAPAIPPADVLGRLAALKTTATPALKQQWRNSSARSRRRTIGASWRAGSPIGSRNWPMAA